MQYQKPTSSLNKLMLLTSTTPIRDRTHVFRTDPWTPKERASPRFIRFHTPEKTAHTSISQSKNLYQCPSTPKGKLAYNDESKLLYFPTSPRQVDLHKKQQNIEKPTATSPRRVFKAAENRLEFLIGAQSPNNRKYKTLQNLEFFMSKKRVRPNVHDPSKQNTNLYPHSVTSIFTRNNLDTSQDQIPKLRPAEVQTEEPSLKNLIADDLDKREPAARTSHSIEKTILPSIRDWDHNSLHICRSPATSLTCQLQLPRTPFRLTNAARSDREKVRTPRSSIRADNLRLIRTPKYKTTPKLTFEFPSEIEKDTTVDISTTEAYLQPSSHKGSCGKNEGKALKKLKLVILNKIKAKLIGNNIAI